MASLLQLVSNSPEETQNLGKALGAFASPGDIILLTGGLGVGKTCLAQGVGWGLGLREHVRSSTFVLVSEYRGRLPLYHIDLYRIEKVEEIWDLGLDEYLFGDGVCVVEWAEKAPEVFPQQHLLVQIEYLGETQRRLTLKANGSRGERLLRAAREAIQPDGTGS